MIVCKKNQQVEMIGRISWKITVFTNQFNINCHQYISETEGGTSVLLCIPTPRAIHLARTKYLSSEHIGKRTIGIIDEHSLMCVAEI